MIKFFKNTNKKLLYFFVIALGLFNGFTTTSFVLNDAPYPWQIGFQDPASPGFSGIFNLHNDVIFFLIFILLSVVWILGVVIVLYKKNLLSAKYLNHATLSWLLAIS